MKRYYLFCVLFFVILFSAFANKSTAFLFDKELEVTDEPILIPAASVREVEIDIDVASVYLSVGKDFSVRAEKTSEIEVLTKLEPDGSLEIWDTRRRWFRRKIKEVPKIYITIPENSTFSSFDIETDIGSVMGSNLSIETREASFSVDVGSIKIEGINSFETEIDADVGTIELKGNFSGETEISCDVGSVKLTSSGDIDTWSYSIKAKLGAIKINENEFTGILNQKAPANKKNHFEIECNLGAVEILVTENSPIAIPAIEL